MPDTEPGTRAAETVLGSVPTQADEQLLTETPPNDVEHSAVHSWPITSDKITFRHNVNKLIIICKTEADIKTSNSY